MKKYYILKPNSYKLFHHYFMDLEVGDSERRDIMEAIDPSAKYLLLTMQMNVDNTESLIYMDTVYSNSVDDIKKDTFGCVVYDYTQIIGESTMIHYEGELLTFFEYNEKKHGK